MYLTASLDQRRTRFACLVFIWPPIAWDCLLFWKPNAFSVAFSTASTCSAPCSGPACSGHRLDLADIGRLLVDDLCCPPPAPATSTKLRLDATEHELPSALRAQSGRPKGERKRDSNPAERKPRLARRSKAKLQTGCFRSGTCRRHCPRRAWWSAKAAHWHRCTHRVDKVDDDAGEPTWKGRVLQGCQEPVDSNRSSKPPSNLTSPASPLFHPFSPPAPAIATA